VNADITSADNFFQVGGVTTSSNPKNLKQIFITAACCGTTFRRLH